MILDIQFTENNQLFNTTFGEVHNVSDGGYERGYEKGYEEGFDDGFDDAYREEQEKSVDITENCTTEITPDDDLVLSKVIVNVDVPDKSKELENIIDESKVLDSTDGTATEKVEQLIDKAEDDKLWYFASENINFINQNSPFAGTKWEHITIPKVNFSKTTTLLYTFGSSAIEYIDYYINSSSCTNCSNAFSYCKKLKRIKGIDISKATSVNDMFAVCVALEEITDELNLSNATNLNKMFNECNKLKEIRFVPETIKKSITIPSPVLSAESIQSIVDGLAEAEDVQALSLNSAVIDKLTDDQWEEIGTKNWTVE